MEDDEIDILFPTGASGEDNEILAAIGHVAVAWARFEFVLNDSICMIGRIPHDTGECLTSQIASISLRFDAFSAVCHVKGCSEKLLKKINSFRDGEAIPLSLKRNRIVHDPWMRGVQTGKPYRLEVSAKRRLVSEFKPHTVEEIKAIANNIEELGFRFSDLFREILTETNEASRRKET